MKTLTITYHHTCNYGAVLQAYALQQVIIAMGHKNIIFEYPYDDLKKNNYIGKSLYEIIRILFINTQKILRKKENTRLKQYFKEFHNNYMELTRVYSSMMDLKENCPDVDALITGSDQVFNLHTLPEFVPARLLQFGSEKCIKFSYAASLEKKDYTDEQKQMVKNSLKYFKGISFREQGAKEYFKTFIDDMLFVEVLDPVFLLPKSKWEKIMIKPRIQSPYILVYQVQSNRRIKEVTKFLKKALGYPIVSINNSCIKWTKADKTLYDVSLEEFLGFYRNAAVVVAASYHGVALALTFGKPVYAMVKEGSSSRISDLMHKFDLDDFCIDEKCKLKIWDINTQILQKKIQEEREYSLMFLRNMLSNED